MARVGISERLTTRTVGSKVSVAATMAGADAAERSQVPGRAVFAIARAALRRTR